MLTLERFLPYRLNRLAAAVSHRLKGVYGRKYDLTVPEWRVLATLGQYGALTATDIAAHSAMHKTKVSRAVRALELRRWLAREEKPEDRRIEMLRLTDQGTHTYRRITPEMSDFEARLLKSLGPDRTVMVLAALDDLEEILGLRG